MTEVGFKRMTIVMRDVCLRLEIVFYKNKSVAAYAGEIPSSCSFDCLNVRIGRVIFDNQFCRLGLEKNMAL